MCFIGFHKRTGKLRLTSPLINILSYGCLTIANICGPAVFAIQMAFIDVLIYSYCKQAEWAWFFMTLEVLLLTHMLLHAGPEHITRSGSLQWIIYSWLMAVKGGVLYFQVLPQLSVDDVITLRAIVSIMCLSPVYYCIVTFRTLRQVSQGEAGGDKSRLFSWGDEAGLDVLLLQDMVWHVVIDLVDITSMIVLTKLTDDSLAEVLGRDFPARVEAMTFAAGVFAVLALFFHQQSFPSISFATSSSIDDGSPDGSDVQIHRPTGLISQTMTGQLSRVTTSTSETFSISRVTSNSSRGGLSYETTDVSVLTKTGRPDKPYAKSKTIRYGVDVVKARKRSAIVSILLVDLPFFGIRTAQYVLAIKAAESPSAPPIDAISLNQNETRPARWKSGPRRTTCREQEEATVGQVVDQEPALPLPSGDATSLRAAG
eukprot:TRINITY_DN36543_c0_g2_i2.p1 TRINITY_DN36543_c0_g2~~TRINITY_DN36543_c0_g2_i2.p1  ORF type:complete len:461 (-),score=39.32 TRINITY_DN36543_c0_g2_i2:587-1870(-)